MPMTNLYWILLSPIFFLNRWSSLTVLLYIEARELAMKWQNTKVSKNIKQARFLWMLQITHGAAFWWPTLWWPTRISIVLSPTGPSFDMALVALEHRASSCHQHSHLQRKQHNKSNKSISLKRNVSMKMMNPGNCLLGQTLVCLFGLVLVQVPCHSGSNLWRLLGDDILIPRMLGLDFRKIWQWKTISLI